MDKSGLFDKAQNHIRKGHWDKAIELMVEVHRLDESDPMVTLRLGDLYKKLGFDRDAAEYYLKTADLYAAAEVKTKAAAIYKMVLRMAPGMEEAQRKLDSLTTVHRPAPPPAPAPEAVHQTPPTPPTAVETPSPPRPAEPPVRPPEVFYGSSEHRAETKAAEFVHETIPGLVELGSTVGRLVMEEFEGPGSQSSPQSGIDLSAGRPGVEIESFAMNKAASRGNSDETVGEGIVGGSGSVTDFELPPAAPPAQSSGDNDTMFTDFAADAEAAPPAATPPGTPARKEIEFLGDLAEDELWDLLGRMNRLTFGPGEPIIREGDTGDSIYIISSGSVMVSSTRNGMTVKLAELHDNDFFGEVSFLTGNPRTADVTAIETTTVMELSRAETDGLIRKYPGVEKVLRMFQKERVADTIATMKAVSCLW